MASDGVTEIPGTSATIKMHSFGPDVHRAVVAVLDPAESANVLGFTLESPSGTSGPLAMISITRFDADGNVIHNAPVTFEIDLGPNAPEDVGVFRYVDGSTTGTAVPLEGGSVGPCAPARDGCFLVTSLLTSAFVAFQGGAVDCETEEGGHELTLYCPYEAILMEHCYKCFYPPDREVIHCDGWSEDDIMAQCVSATPVASPSPSDQEL